MANKLPIDARKVGATGTQPMANNHVLQIEINPCACIDKIMKAADAKAKEQPKNDLTGDKKAKNMRSARNAVRFNLAVKAYEIGKVAKSIYGSTEVAGMEDRDYITLIATGKFVGKWQLATDDQLKDYGFKQGRREFSLTKIKDGKRVPSHFKAGLYIPVKERFCYEMPAILAFRGTVMGTFDEAVESWANNIAQACNLESAYYDKAVKLGNLVKNAKKPVAIAGHSLGGGLATACAVTSNKECWHYNAAGLHPATVARYGGTVHSPTIHAIRHKGEILTRVQESSRVEKEAAIAALGFHVAIASTVLPNGMALAALTNGYLAKKIREAPIAPCTGIKIDIEPIQPSTQSGIKEGVKHAVFLHGMSETLDSFRDLLQKQEAQVRKDLGVECKSLVVQ